jgi:hypothetical protein
MFEMTGTATVTGSDLSRNTGRDVGGAIYNAGTITVTAVVKGADANAIALSLGAGNAGSMAIGGATLAGGVDGTPAVIGRLATDGTDVWTALVNDTTVEQAGWVKTFTAGA